MTIDGPPQKPPLGVMPRRLWLEHRSWDLLNALIRYSEHQQALTRWTHADEMREWSQELADIYSEIAFIDGEEVAA